MQLAETTASILVVDDEMPFLESLRFSLERQGYHVLTASDGLSGLRIARAEKPDLIILDVMLPGMDGFKVCQALRRDSDVPVIMLTARDDETDKVVGLELGADDYVTKPFGLRELLARVRAVLRRRDGLTDGAATDVDGVIPRTEGMTFGDLVVSPQERRVLLHGNEVPLRPREFDLLTYLVRNRGIALSRQQLLDNVWGIDYYGDPRTVDVHMRQLREKIEAEPATPTRLVTVRGHGYRFEG
ncbi:MAG: response regulator transcription factor [Chloroflexota bacterium]|nr:response regulator transcription factor [Chloroflexota bacterium]